MENLTRVTLLLCARLSSSLAPRPLSISEYYKLVNWLEERSLDLGMLLTPKGRIAVSKFPDSDRVLTLLRRTSDVDLVLQHWADLGIWVLAEHDPKFPQRLRTRLRSACMPLLFGAGSIDLLNRGGLCVVGSRDCGLDALEFASTIGRRAGNEDMLVISSDMRGVDRQVLLSTLEEGGRAVCVVSDSLEKTVSSRRYREALANGRACLVTPFTPDTHFAVANAMRANRYQYGLSDAALIVEARQTGGIWSGAEENRKHRWVPAFVRAGPQVSSGNAALVHLGLFPVTLEDIKGCTSLAELLINLVQFPRHVGDSAHQRPIVKGQMGQTMFVMFVEEIQRLDRELWDREDLLTGIFDLEVEQIRTWLKKARKLGFLSDGELECPDKEVSR